MYMYVYRNDTSESCNIGVAAKYIEFLEFFLQNYPRILF